MRLIHVAVPVPQLGPLTYSVPDEFPDPAVGVRVLVPVGKRTMTGVVLGVGTRDPGAIKPIIDILDATPFLPSDVVTLATWVAEYYACGSGESIAAAMPPRAWIASE